ncbi:site-specific DNA-methyltransferase [Providencia stuartii]|uniref:site-specific DNA-methyltransferase (adenine-specific) n=1 Tax=Providencia stuartii (strain MRSN 2154) TaxID=1157951 RepID=A0A140NN72_PROSM|nr:MULTISPECIES: site-specific DNA-methyltransferase [Providencia]AFH94351.1 type III restriction-modification system methyltransferase [Providencia stuartii MRSN 2154]MDE8746175.1 site-specific DNA-methyltransferase [Providencia thailandensis]MDE8765037.1 site-specific DNA-methyltransferase [Providencia thailandensis]MDE8777433.1 site-specific DNA-methyltransferase [Providencia thailandensis]MDE8781422.1 site-specific DNA-methyltransferase [Providencia thailandensis]
MNKLKMHSPDMTQQNIEKIQALFPNCVTESKGANGELKLAIDFDQLKQELSNSIVEGPQERYQLNWPGKREALLTANAPIAKTLRPCREESVNFDTTKNLFIEGDNLDALKLMQETYLGKVKMIYIDPPYNTGKDFIYADNFAESTEEYLLDSGQKDEGGNRLVANTDSNGRFHSDWLSMMYSRLKLAITLLKDAGVIFISIDDNEVSNLRKMCDEIFGEDNFIANIIWSRKRGKDNSAKFFSRNHEHLIVYAKNIRTTEFGRLDMPEETRKAYKNPDNDSRGDYRLLGVWARGSQGGSLYDFKSKTGEYFTERKWLVGKGTMEALDSDNKLKFNGDKVYRKLFLTEYKGDIPETIWLDASNAANAADEIKALLGTQVFDTVKPIPYLLKMIKCGLEKDDVILDFFAGSATTAHATMQLNAEDGGNRKFVMVQLPEECDKKSEAFKAGYKNIAEISKERIRRAGAKILEGECHKDWNKDVGFRVLKVDSSNMADVYYSPDQVTQGSLDLLVDNIKADRTDEDLLFQVLLDWGVDLTLPIRKETIQGKSVFLVDDDALVACFDLRINEALIKELAAKEPLRVVFRDDGFESDAVKINAEQIFKQVSPHTEVKAI